MEERKRRLERKYLQEQVEADEATIVLPSVFEEEDEQLKEWERYGKGKDMFDREESGSGAMPPPARPMPRPRQSSNWLLEDIEEDTTNPYGTGLTDPFAKKESVIEPPKRYDFWNREDQSQEQAGTAGRSRYNPYASRERILGGSSTSSDGTVSGSSLYGSSGTESSLYGRQSGQDSTPYRGLGTQRTYGSSPQSGLLGSSYRQGEEGSGTSRSSLYGAGRASGPSSATPSYGSPYQRSGTEQRGSALNGAGSRSQQPEYQSPTMRRRKQQSFDPTSDDAYLRDIMPDSQR